MIARKNIDASEVLHLDHVHVSDVSYSGKNVSRLVVTQSKFESCDFSHMKAGQACFGAGMERSIYKKCTFDNSVIRASAPGVARFEECTFLGSHFSELNCRNVEFVDCVFSGSIDKGYFCGSINANGLPIKKIEFHGNDFSLAELIDIDFRSGIDLAKQKLPIGDQYFYIDRVEDFLDGLDSLVSMAPLEEKKILNVLRQMIERDFSGGQLQIFLNSNGFPDTFRATFDRIRSTLCALR
ncbi:hypothetical protein [Burkholderia cepacia]|uniref:hypothetical protein n=1 Tax=Burkholderia cepacia TaxID=292 RepID=UPI00158B6ED9|nr:hypothetical protein [Burkholderia cepacia]